MNSFEEVLKNHLAERRTSSSYRTQRLIDNVQGPEVDIDGARYLNFASNDYLGLAQHPRIINAVQSAALRLGVGSTASALMCGHHSIHRQLESELAALLRRDRVLLFSSGYMANLGIATALIRPGDLIVQDSLNHASLIDAGLLCRARFTRFPHGEIEKLEAILANRGEARAFVMTDAIFSMDGDIADLPRIAALCRRHDAILVVDDAHGFGVLGARGLGTLDYFNLSQSDVPVMMATFGKALGVSGAFAAGPEYIIETLIQDARTYVYTTAMAPMLAAAVSESLRAMTEEIWRRQHLNALVRYFKERVNTGENRLRFHSMTPIQPLNIGDNEATEAVSAQLYARGFLVPAIRPPTVPQGSARIRISLNAMHTEAQVDRLSEALHELLG